MTPPYKAAPPSGEPPKFLIVEGPGLAAERQELEGGPLGPGAGGGSKLDPAATETPAGDTQIEPRDG